MKQLLFKTNSSYAPMIQRVLAAIVLWPHGAQKLLGWFGGFGFTGTMNFFTQTMGLPSIVGLFVIILEFFGSIALLLGLFTRITATAITILFLGIVFTSHIQNGFFMNWFGTQKGEGCEYFLLFIAITVSLSITGAGKWSTDSLIFKNKHVGS